ncbi:hypothetical protein CLOP_g1199 [Closterium sp. NIES-67]|nr:hypothetical protein CLOP_g1199 [Closterium sp. NIES-67]
MMAIRDSFENADMFMPQWGGMGDICGPLGWAPEVMCDMTESGNYTIIGISIRGALRGSLSPLILDLENLSALQLSSLYITKPGLLKTIKQLTQLNTLDITNVAVGFTTAELDLSGFTNLESLTLRNVLMTGPIAKLNLPSLPNLHFLDLGQNRLTGELPEGLSSIVQMDLSTNQLSGMLPTDLLSSPNVTSIMLYNNRLQGALPDVFSSATKLRTLELSLNKLVGTLPPSLAESRTLTYIDLSTNQFVGKLPRFFAACTITNVSAYLNVSSNKLTGKLPNSLALYTARNTAALTLDLSYNDLSGSVPEGLFAADAFFYDHNDGLCGAPHIPACNADGTPSADRAGVNETAAAGGLFGGPPRGEPYFKDDGTIGYLPVADPADPAPPSPDTDAADGGFSEGGAGEGGVADGAADDGGPFPGAVPIFNKDGTVTFQLPNASTPATPSADTKAAAADTAATAVPSSTPALTCTCEQLSAGAIFGIAFGAAVLAGVLVAAVVLTWLHYGSTRGMARVEGAGFVFAPQNGEKMGGVGAKGPKDLEAYN